MRTVPAEAGLMPTMGALRAGLALQHYMYLHPPGRARGHSVSVGFLAGWHVPRFRPESGRQRTVSVTAL